MTAAFELAAATAVAETIEPERLLSDAIAVSNNRHWQPHDTAVVVAVSDVTPARVWILSFCPKDRCFAVVIDGHERLRTDSPQIACGYFSARLPR